jgi:hypothetical protein
MFECGCGDDALPFFPSGGMGEAARSRRWTTVAISSAARIDAFRELLGRLFVPPIGFPDSETC